MPERLSPIKFKKNNLKKFFTIKTKEVYLPIVRSKSMGKKLTLKNQDNPFNIFQFKIHPIYHKLMRIIYEEQKSSPIFNK